MKAEMHSMGAQQVVKLQEEMASLESEASDNSRGLMVLTTLRFL